MMHDAEWHEVQYNPRLTVKDAHLVMPGWRKRAMATRERFPPQGDLKYGPHPRENIDLFRPENPKGTVVYIHGGYWRMLSKLETSFVAEDFVRAGYTVALINYPLSPDRTVFDIRASVVRAFVYLYREKLLQAEKSNIVVTGHSAGGHMAALHLATDWSALGLPVDPIKAVVSLSGVFDVEPLIQTSMNADLRLNAATARPLNLLKAPLLSRAKLVLAVGADEPGEFQRQTTDMAEHWKELAPDVMVIPATNHYTIVDRLSEPGGPVHQKVLDFLEAPSFQTVAQS